MMALIVNIEPCMVIHNCMLYVSIIRDYFPWRGSLVYAYDYDRDIYDNDPRTHENNTPISSSIFFYLSKLGIL